MQASSNKPLILVDGSSYLYRAFHALPALTNSKGFPTGAVYGMVNMLRRLLADYHPEYMAVVFDAKGKTFRDEIYQAYKATRREMPNELIQQISPIHQIIQAMGLPILTVEGVEADDVIGTLASQAKDYGLQTIISTGDKDLAQLVNESVTLINTMSNTTLDPEGVKAKFGVWPDRMVDYLTLVGDSSDNIPGVPLVGPKTAAKWLQEYGSLDNLVSHADKISGKAGENLRTSITNLPLTQSLVTIKMDVELPFDLTALKIKPADKTALINFYKDLEFKTWLSELLSASQEDNKKKYAHYKIVDSKPALQALVKQLEQASLFAMKVEIVGTNFITPTLVGLAFATTPDSGHYVPFGHKALTSDKQLIQQEVLAALKPILENPEKSKVLHNIKYAIEALAFVDIHLQGAVFDTMMESYLLDSVSNAHEIESLSLKYLGRRTIPLEELAGKGSKQLTLDQLEIPNVANYAAEAVDVTLQLHQVLWPRIEKEPGLKYIFETIEIPLICVLARMELAGVLIDPKKLAAQEQELQNRLTILEQEVYQHAGKPFNINSPKQLQEILFEILKLPVLQKTPTGQPSTADSVLQELALEFAIPRTIIEYRSLSKLISTYTSRLGNQIDRHTGRVHTSYNQSGTATGRLSSSDPNLQNIPVKTSEGRRIRQAFIAPKGYQIISADYSQIELRIMAHISQDPNLLKAFVQNQDIHLATAAEVWGVSIAEVTAEMRRNAKAINFGLMYGMSAFGLSRQLGIEVEAASKYINTYFTRYPNVKNYMDMTRAAAKQKGYVETLWGRRLYLPDINSSQIPRQRASERAAINGPLQGSAADIIKLAMINIDHWINEEHIAARMIMQVHDELVFEVAEKDVEAAVASIRKFMCEVVTLSVPLAVSIGTGENWDASSAH